MKEYKFDLNNEKDFKNFMALSKTNAISKVLVKISEDAMAAKSLGEIKTLFSSILNAYNATVNILIDDVKKDIGAEKITEINLQKKEIKYV